MDNSLEDDPCFVLSPTDEKDNFQRVARLLICGGTTLLRQTFDAIHPPHTLPALLSNPSTKEKLRRPRLNQTQLNCLYPSPGRYGSSADFDFSLLVCLLRDICNLTPPVRGLDGLPHSTDISLTADLARIKHYRNSVYAHPNPRMDITAREFAYLWKNISDALVRIAGHLSPKDEAAWRTAIDLFFEQPLTLDALDRDEELKRLCEYEEEVDESLAIVEQETYGLGSRLREMTDRFEHAMSNILQNLLSLSSVRSQSAKDSKPLKSLLKNELSLQRICSALDIPVPGCRHYDAVAKHYGFDYFKMKFSVGGPSRALIETLAASHPNLTVERFATIVEKMTRRKDVARLLREYDSAGEKEIGSAASAQQLPDDDGGNNSDNEKKYEEVDDDDGRNVGEEVTEGGEQLSQQLYEVQTEEQQHLAEEEANKIRLFEGQVTSEGTHLDLKLGAVHLTFPPDAVSEPTSIAVHKWKSSACSPQLQEHEAIVSNVIEISTTTNEALQFKVKVKLVFSHCAPDLQGYELVIKRLINKETNDWKEVEGTVDVRELSDLEDDYPNEVPDFSFPVVQADIAECSIYTVICRLKPSPTYTISSSGGCFNHPDYPGVAVSVPKKAVSVKSKFPLQLKVQETPNDEFEGRNVYVGPILRISCTQGIEFLKPVTIQLPVAPRVEGGTIPDPLICRVRVLFLRSDGENKEWVDITDDLEIPARFDGTSVTFQVKRFSGYSCDVSWHKHKHSRDWNSGGIVCFLSNIFWTQPRLAYFFAYFRLSECSLRQNILYLICCPAHLRDRVNHELKREGIRSHEASSRKRMIPGRDKAFVSVSGGISPVNEEDMADICLMLEADEQSRDTLLIRLISDQEKYGFVEFRSTREPVEENKLAKLPLTLPTLNVTHQPQDETVPGLRVKEGQPEDEELEMLANEIGEDWIPLGRRLKFGESPLIGFDKDKSKYSEKPYAMLLRWKHKGGTKNATYQILREALCHELVGRTDLAEKYCC